jgi:hypothetical protein
MMTERIHITEVTNREDGSQVVRGFFVQNAPGNGAPASPVTAFERTLTGDDRNTFAPGSDYTLSYVLVEQSAADAQVAPARPE